MIVEIEANTKIVVLIFTDEFEVSGAQRDAQDRQKERLLHPSRDLYQRRHLQYY